MVYLFWEFFFVGSATYALFNENLLLNDATSDIQSNDTSLSNNQPNTQNNPDNSQNNPLTNIISGENSNSNPNNMANVVLSGISEINDDGGQKVVKEVSRFTVDNKTLVEFDDSSFAFTVNNHTSNGKFVLTKIYNQDSVSGGYMDCSDCGKFIPVGDVSGLVPEDYLCDCGAYVIGKNVPWVYSEESVLEYIKLGEDYYKYNDKPVDNPFDAPSTNTDNSDTSNASDEVTQENVENTYINNEDSYSPIVLPSMSDHMNLPWIKPQLMNPLFNNEDS